MIFTQDPRAKGHALARAREREDERERTREREKERWRVALGEPLFGEPLCIQ